MSEAEWCQPEHVSNGPEVQSERTGPSELRESTAKSAQELAFRLAVLSVNLADKEETGDER